MKIVKKSNHYLVLLVILFFLNGILRGYSQEKEAIKKTVNVFLSIDTPQKALKAIAIFHPYTYRPLSKKEFVATLKEDHLTNDAEETKNALTSRIKFISNIVKTDTTDYAYVASLTSFVMKEDDRSVTHNGNLVAKSMQRELRASTDKNGTVKFNTEDNTFTIESTTQTILIKEKDFPSWRVLPIDPSDLIFIKDVIPQEIIDHIKTPNH